MSETQILSDWFFNKTLSEWVKVAQSCPTICHPMDYTVHGILQVRVLEWVAFPFSLGSSQPRDRTQVSHIAGRLFTSLVSKIIVKGLSSSKNYFLRISWQSSCLDLILVTAVGQDSIPGQGTKVIKATWYSQKKRDYFFFQMRGRHTTVCCPSICSIILLFSNLVQFMS